MNQQGTYFCQRCRQRFVISADTTDFVHECNSPSVALNTDDMITTGDWTDYTGTGVKNAPTKYLGITNKLAGTRGHIQFRKRLPPLTRKANNKQIFRERQHLEFQEIPKEPNAESFVK